MKQITTLLGVLSLIMLVALPLSIQAKEPNEVEVHTSSESAGSAMPVPGVVVQEKEVMDDSSNDDSDSDENGATDMSKGEEHRSRIAGAVQNLLSIGDRIGGIGKEVSDIAREQEVTHEEASHAIDRLEKRNGFMTFLIGTDYASVGVLRSSLVTTENHILRLEKAKERTSGSIATDIESEVQVLKSENESIRAFIDENEGKFSLLGWLARYFAE